MVIRRFKLQVGKYLWSSLYYAIKVKVKVAQLCPTQATPWTVACDVPLSMEFQARHWSG